MLLILPVGWYCQLIGREETNGKPYSETAKSPHLAAIRARLLVIVPEVLIASVFDFSRSTSSIFHPEKPDPFSLTECNLRIECSRSVLIMEWRIQLLSFALCMHQINAEVDNLS